MDEGSILLSLATKLPDFTKYFSCPKAIKVFFIINSAGHDIFPAHKC